MPTTIAQTKTQSNTAAAVDREFWIIVAFCTVGLAATMYIFEHLPRLVESVMVFG